MSLGKYVLPLVPPTANQQQQIVAYHNAGGIVEFAVFAVHKKVVLTGYDLHQEIAKQALWHADDHLAANARIASAQTGRPVDYYHRLTFDYAKMSGRVCALLDFLGPYYDSDQGTILIPAANTTAPNQLHPANQPPTSTNQRPKPATKAGYAYAFAHPPDGLRLDGPALHHAFQQINSYLFESPTADLEIYEWAGPWSNYFEPWGAWLWTLYCPQRRRIATIAVAASA